MFKRSGRFFHSTVLCLESDCLVVMDHQFYSRTLFQGFDVLQSYDLSLL